ncbi:uncharacterized protein [Pleurodeles waltl]|uniref:uncharacterized protein isoform X1 n=1 Tax=Pleurodeles waltl TaxID=8319 RepID=UPI003709B531
MARAVVVLAALCTFLVNFPSQAFGAPESCSDLCGVKLTNCSCLVTCKGLGTCCYDYSNFCVEISPYSGTLLGGTDFTIQGPTFNTNSSVVRCRFNNETVTRGYIDDAGAAHCISPLLYETGRIPFALSVDNGATYPHTGVWLAVHHSKASVQEKSVLVNAKKWQYYGTPGFNGTLSLTWSSRVLKSGPVKIELWGYRETGVPYSQTWEPEWSYLYTLTASYPNNGTFMFIPSPGTTNFSSWEVGLLRISSSTFPAGEQNIAAIWSPVHALAWNLGEDFRESPAAWASKKCFDWNRAEKELPNFLEEIPDCPCTLAQARADTGRYHTDYGCDMEKGSVCTYHPGAIHCVRSIQSSPKYGSGQQCCYDSTGAQVLTKDTLGGSTPDRGHDWGSPPYKKPPRIPSFSHWLYDVITFYYCCLWSDNCQYYLERRPSSECRTYTPPRVASIFGDPHSVTFDGANFTFKGKGEYTLVQSSTLTIQGRTQPVGTNHSAELLYKRMNSSVEAHGLSSVAMQENGSDVIEVRHAEAAQEAEDLEVLLNQKVISFREQPWMDLKGVFVFSNSGKNVTVMFSSGAGVEVRGMGKFLSVMVLLPEKFLNDTEGLLGVMNGNPEDDFTFRNGTLLPTSASPEELYRLGADWAITNETTLFTYDSLSLENNFVIKHDPTYIPVFRVEEDPNDPLTEEMLRLCESDEFCRFDTLTTKSLLVGNTTKISHQRHQKMVESLKPVVCCGWLGPPANGTKEGTSYIFNSDVKFTCNPGFIMFGSQVRTCLSSGAWSGEETECKTGVAHSCAGQCGRNILGCSCRPTCENLGTCCPDYKRFCIQIAPQSGILLGGTDIVVLNVTFDVASNITCRFGDNSFTKGHVDIDGTAHCISPMLYETGRIPFAMSVDGGASYPYSSSWISVHTGKVAISEKSQLVNETKWQYYGTPGTSGTLTIDWEAEVIQESHVNIEVWGYEENGTPYSSSWSAEWKYLYSLRKNLSNSGSFTFIPEPSPAPYNRVEVGSVRISPASCSDGQWNVLAIWSTDHALAWHLGNDFRKDSASWAKNKCVEWYQADRKLPNFLENIIDCPCTLAQSQADTGRFHVDYGCDIDKGSVCTYHPGAVHCVRAIQGSSDYASGQQCCYDASGFQVLTKDSIGGSTPDRGHDWGSPPYKNPPRVPVFSHWIYDVISFYYCCLWSDNCQYYLDLRPSKDCRTYTPPRAASTFGDPHFITADGSNYTFNGRGEYTLVHAPIQNLTIQGRTQPVMLKNGSYAQVTGFSSVVMREGPSDKIEVRCSNSSQELEILLNEERIAFNEINWMDLKGVFVYSPVKQNVTVMFTSGAGVEVRRAGDFLGISVLLPENFKNGTQGLLGVMNDIPDDDYTFRNGTILDISATAEQLFEFGADWSVTNESSLFTYDSQHLIELYQTKHDTDFQPVFTVDEDPNDPLTTSMHELCQNDDFCRFDVLGTRSLEVGNATKISHQRHQKLVGSLEPVKSCGWLAAPKNGNKRGTTYLEGKSVQFACNEGYILMGSSERTCHSNGMWTGEEAQCVADNTLAIVLGSVFAFLALLTLILVIIFHEWKQARKQKSYEPKVAFDVSKEKTEFL